MARPGGGDGAGNGVAEPWRRRAGHSRRRRRAGAGAEPTVFDDWAAAGEAVPRWSKKSKEAKLFVSKRLYADNFGEKKFKINFLKIGLFATQLRILRRKKGYLRRNSGICVANNPFSDANSNLHRK